MKLSARAYQVNRAILAATFAGIGMLHFLQPEPFVRIVPRRVPYPAAAVAVSGLAEIVLGIGVLPKPTRKFCGWGLLLLLAAVFPANIQMALDWHRAEHPAQWVAWARLPLQPVIGWWVWKTAIAGPE